LPMEMQTTRQQDNRQPGNPYGVTILEFHSGSRRQATRTASVWSNQQSAVMVGRQGNTAAIQRRTCGTGRRPGNYRAH